MAKKEKLTDLENLILGHFLTEWNYENSFDEVFEKDNPDTLVWLNYEDWDLTTLKNHIKELVVSLTNAKV